MVGVDQNKASDVVDCQTYFGNAMEHAKELLVENLKNKIALEHQMETRRGKYQREEDHH
jgi:hypothetical protein